MQSQRSDVMSTGRFLFYFSERVFLSHFKSKRKCQNVYITVFDTHLSSTSTCREGSYPKAYQAIKHVIPLQSSKSPTEEHCVDGRDGIYRLEWVYNDWWAHPLGQSDNLVSFLSFLSCLWALLSGKRTFLKLVLKCVLTPHLDLTAAILPMWMAIKSKWGTRMSAFLFHSECRESSHWHIYG